MKSKIAKAAAFTMAMTMCMPISAFAEDTRSGSFKTSFDVYSPKLTIDVPVNAAIRVNPLAISGDATVKQFTVASNSLDIWNASVDVSGDVSIPVNATVRATITSKKADVATEYNTFAASPTSTKKRINLNLSEAETPATLKLKDGATAAFGADKTLVLGNYEVSGDAAYGNPAESVAVTQYGSLLSVDIAGPTTKDTTNTGATFSTTAGDVSASVGSFAITGTANANADWKADDVAVEITYDVRASRPRNVSTPVIATAPTFSSSSAADVVITIPDTIGEATVAAMGIHNDGEGLYGDYIWGTDEYTVEYKADGTATITIPKDNPTFEFLSKDEYKGKEQDLIIALSDGRRIVSKLTVN